MSLLDLIVSSTVFGKTGIGANDEQRVPAPLLERALHPNDVDLVIAEHLAHHSDHTWAIDVEDQEHVTLRHDLNIELIDLHNARIFLVKERAGT